MTFKTAIKKLFLLTTFWSYFYIFFQRYKVIKKSQNRSDQGFLIFLLDDGRILIRDPEPDPSVWLTDPDPGGPKYRYWSGSATLPSMNLKSKKIKLRPHLYWLALWSPGHKIIYSEELSFLCSPFCTESPPRTPRLARPWTGRPCFRRGRPSYRVSAQSPTSRIGQKRREINLRMDK